MISSGALVAVLAAWALAVSAAAVVFRTRDLIVRWRRARAAISAAVGAGGGSAPPAGDRAGRGPGGILRTVAGAAAVTLSALGWGSAALRLLGPRELTPALVALYGLVLGWGMLSHVIFLLGLVGRLRVRWVAGALAAGVVLGGAASLGPARLPVMETAAAGAASSPVGWIAAAFGLSTLGLLLPASFAPPRAFDAHAYHMELPRRYALSGRLEYVPFMAHSPWPQAVHALFVPGFLFRCVHFAPFTSYLMGLAVAGILFESARIALGLDAAFVSLLLLLALAEFAFQMADATVDVGLGAFTFAAITTFSAWLGSRDTPLLLVAAMFAGFAASTKLTGLVLIPLFSGSALAAGEAGAAGLLLAVSCVVAAPWYARAARLTGNPVFHFATGVFRTRNWAPSSEEAHRLVAEAGRWGPVRDAHGIGRYLREQVLRSPTGWGPGIVGLAPAALLLPLERSVAIAGGISLALAVLTLLATRQIRLLLGAGAGLSLAASGGFAGLSAGTSAPGWYPLVLVTLLGGLALWGALDANHHKLRIVFGRSGAASFLRRFLPYYDDFVWINAHAPRDARVLLWTTRGYLLERDYVWLPPWQQGIFDFTRIRTARDFWEALKQRGVTHVYFTEYEIDRGLFRYLYDLHEEMVRSGLLVEEKRFEREHCLFRVA